MSEFSIDSKELAGLCRKYAPQLAGTLVGKDLQGRLLDPARVLWALCGNESDFGANFSPRHEDSYCHGHVHFDAPATKLWGCWAHCSYGVTQVMFKNAGGNPLSLAVNVEMQLQATVAMLKRPEFHHQDLDGIGKLWNGPAESALYQADFRKNYLAAM